MKTTAIIVAAGSGSRFNSDTPKQFLEINGKPIIEYTIERFVDAPSVDKIILILAADQRDRVSPIDPSKPITIVTGGPTRAHSVLNGLIGVSDDTSIVAVHDGARPLVTVDEIERTIDAAKRTGAACLVAPVTDTIKSINGNEITATVDRNKLRRALTPQAFKMEVLRKAFEGVDLDESITDECYLVEKLGHPITVVEGGARNIKITHPDDMLVAEILFRARN